METFLCFLPPQQISFHCLNKFSSISFKVIVQCDAVTKNTVHQRSHVYLDRPACFSGMTRVKSNKVFDPGDRSPTGKPYEQNPTSRRISLGLIDRRTKSIKLPRSNKAAWQFQGSLMELAPLLTCLTACCRHICRSGSTGRWDQRAVRSSLQGSPFESTIKRE
jgi:hypothetical protein